MSSKLDKSNISKVTTPEDYGSLVVGIGDLLEQSRRQAARSVNSFLTSTYWEIGHRIVEFEQGGDARAEYGEELLGRLSKDLTSKHGRGFSRTNLQQMRLFYLGWEICQTVSGKSVSRIKCQTVSGESKEAEGQIKAGEPEDAMVSSAQPGVFPLSWSHYVQLISVPDLKVRSFYEAEAVRGGWSVRQLDRQISTQCYERSANSKNKEAMLARGQIAKPEDAVSVEESIRDPYLLEFLNLRDEYSESDLEDAIIHHYTREHLMEPGENEPVGLILCSAKNDAVVHYAMGGIKANVFASRYMTDLPDEKTLRREILITQQTLRERLRENK